MRATIEARRELGPEYESALVESFLDKVDAALTARVKAELDARMGPAPTQPPSPPPRAASNHDALWIALISMGTGIPLTAIAANTAGTAGLLLAWVGIVMVNLAAALSRRR